MTSSINRHRTGWFRNEAFLRTLARLLDDVDDPSILFHACASGEEPLSFAAVWSEMTGRAIVIHATDADPEILAQAASSIHPRVTPYARSLVRFLPAMSCTETVAQAYDAVVCNNALCYLSADDQRQALYQMAATAWRYLCVTAASPPIVRCAIRETGMRPVWRNWLPIYYGWRERLSWGHRKVWKLPYFPCLLPHWRYAGTTIFYRPHMG